MDSFFRGEVAKAATKIMQEARVSFEEWDEHREGWLLWLFRRLGKV